MKRILFFLLVFPPIFSLHAQSLIAKFAKLSAPEKCWAIFHPFVARKAFHATLQTKSVTDSILKTAIIGNDNSGGRLDAFKHAYWMGSVSLAIGPRKALQLGRAHERGNKLQFKKHQKEDDELPDSVSSCMDLFNNEQGAMEVKEHPGISYQVLQKNILERLKKGQLKCILKNAKGEFLTCDREVIHPEEWYGKWSIPKCLVSSDHSELGTWDAPKE